MSFSSQVKKEMWATFPEKECCQKAECYGMLLGSRRFSLREVVLKSEYEDIARRFCRLLKEVCGISARLNPPARSGGFYSVRLTAPFDCLTVLTAFGYSGDEPFLRINRGNFEEDCCVSAFLRGIFLSCGSIRISIRSLLCCSISIPIWSLLYCSIYIITYLLL
jgi:DNA-binding transcriptional regulator WhiA